MSDQATAEEKDIDCDVCSARAKIQCWEDWEELPPGWWILVDGPDEDTIRVCSLQCAHYYENHDEDDDEDDEEEEEEEDPDE